MNYALYRGIVIADNENNNAQFVPDHGADFLCGQLETAITR